MKYIILLFILLTNPLYSFTCEQKCTVTRVVDGDTLWCNNYKVRLVCINTPERLQKGYLKAKLYLKKRLLHKNVCLDIDKKHRKDKYGRLLAVVLYNGKNINAELLHKKYAKIWKYFRLKNSEFNPYKW